DTVLHTALQVVQDANTLLTPFLPHSAQKVHDLLGGKGVWAAQPELKEVEDLDVAGQINPILTGDYAAEPASWESTPIEVCRPAGSPSWIRSWRNAARSGHRSSRDQTRRCAAAGAGATSGAGGGRAHAPGCLWCQGFRRGVHNGRSSRGGRGRPGDHRGRRPR